MSLHPLPIQPVGAPESEDLGPEVQVALTVARAVGTRAAAWLRTLAAREGERPEWMRGRPNPLLDLADGVEQALSGLDPYDTDERDWESGEITSGYGGVPPEVREQLWEGGSVFAGASGGNRLSPAETAAVLTVATAVRLAADIHGFGYYERDLPVLCRAIDYAVASSATDPRARA
ncbi:hypothetical protein ACFWHG_36795 [Streptomyces microflavus]|uniref:hypothetical protein n=1 Tax=Streptomyces microflavus TaxID=1919 RepID=UPI003658F31B